MATNRYLRNKPVKILHENDNSVVKCEKCGLLDAGRPGPMEQKAAEHAAEHNHKVTIWRTWFLTYLPTKGTK